MGRYFIVAVADDDAALVETNERNQKSRKITVTRPDLTIASMRAPNAAVAGSSIAVQDNTRNQDLVDSASSATKFYLSTDNLLDGGDILLGSRAVPALSARASGTALTNVTIPPATAPGRYFMIGVADANGVVVESNETNNNRSRAITVK